MTVLDTIWMLHQSNIFKAILSDLNKRNSSLKCTDDLTELGHIWPRTVFYGENYFKSCKFV